MILSKSRLYRVSELCKLFGRTKQAYYQHQDTILKKLAEESFVVEYVKSVRKSDGGIGGLKLWQMCHSEFGEREAIGRDRFEAIIAKNGLNVRKRTYTPRTTDSTHGLPTYPNLVKSYIPFAPNKLWVSDITYQKIWDDTEKETYHFCYISLVTDYYTKQIVGYAVGQTLAASYSIEALNMALESSNERSAGLIHHSDRGVQYASYEYIKLLKDSDITISMTESGDPKDNAVAERVNNTLKNELFKGMTFYTIEQVRKAMKTAVDFYNHRRPHMSLDMMTPAEAAKKTGEITKKWTSHRENHIKALKLEEKR